MRIDKQMKKNLFGIIIILLTVFIGIFTTQSFIKPYFFPTWQGDKDSSCDKDFNNPLCSYSIDLHEIPTVSLSELAKYPQFYNGKVIRVQGRYYSELEDYFDSRLYSISDNKIGEQVLESGGIWSNSINETLCSFIDKNAPETNEADVTIIIEFYYITDDKHGGLKRNHNNPLQFTILRVEEMKPVLRDNSKKPLKPRMHQTNQCHRREAKLDI